MLYTDEYIYCTDPNAEEPVINLFGSVGEFEAVSGTIVAQEIAGLEALGKKRIHVRINSSGGEVINGVSIYIALRTCNMEVITYGSYCFSIAAIIFLAGDIRQMYDFGSIMIHDPYNSTGIEDQAVLALKQSLSTIVTGESPHEELIKKMMAIETFITPEEAVQMGFADSVIKTSKKILDLLESKKDIKAKYNLGSLVMNKININDDNMKSNINQDEVINLKDFRSYLASQKIASVFDKKEVVDSKDDAKDVVSDMDEDSDEREDGYEDCDAKADADIDETMDSKDDAKDVVSEAKDDVEGEVMDEVKKELMAAKEELKAMKDAKAKAEKEAMDKKINDLLNTFVKSGKIKNEKAILDAWRSQAEKDFDSTLTILNGFKSTIKANAIPNPQGDLNNKNSKGQVMAGAMKIWEARMKNKSDKK